MRGLRVVVALLAAVTMTVAVSSGASALDAIDPPELLPVSPLIISAYSVVGEQPRYVELHNDSSELVNIQGWTLRVTWTLRQGAPTGASAPVLTPFPIYVNLDGSAPYIPPGGYVVVGFNGAVSNALSQINLNGLPDFTYVSDVRLENTAYRPYVRTITEAQATAGNTMRLNVGTTGYTTTYGTVNSDKIYQDENYYYAPSGGFALAPIEILANPKSCAPLDDDSSCLEYVKFYNHTLDAVNFSGTRLRAGSSTIDLSGIVESGEYALFAVALPNAGGYISLEDKYGIHMYPNTIIEYPDASATSKKGKSWALIEDTWQWAQASPGGANRPIVAEEETASEGSSLVPCRADQYRSPETNRCRLISSASSSLKPCASNQYRSTDTNRCRNITTSSTSLTPCAANQYRNPETNRCRLIASTASSLKPCAADQERNPDTNRCRAVLSAAIPSADFPVEASNVSNDQSLGWVAFAGVGLMALSYAGWEWRYEIVRIFRKLRGLVTKA